VPTAIAGGPVPSPCISVCVIDERTGLCTGCQRTLDEIAAWSVLDDTDRRAVWTRIGLRRAKQNAAVPTRDKD
jgi:uncharacterized protein